MRLRYVVTEMRHGRQIKVQRWREDTTAPFKKSWDTLGKLQIAEALAPELVQVLVQGAQAVGVTAEVKRVARGVRIA